MLSKFPYWETSHHRVHKLPWIILHKHKWIHAQRHFSRFHFSEVRRRKQWAQIEKVSTSERGSNGCDEGGWNYWDQTIWGHTRIGLHEKRGAVECAEHGWDWWQTVSRHLGGIFILKLKITADQISCPTFCNSCMLSTCRRSMLTVNVN